MTSVIPAAEATPQAACRPLSQLTQEFSDKVAWRILRMYREIVWLTRLPQNDKGGAFAGNGYYMKKWKCSAPTVRSYRAALKKYGLIKSLGRGPNVLDVPLVPLEKIVAQFPFFYRLFQRLLPSKFSGFSGRPIPYPTDKEENSNTRSGQTGAKPRRASKRKDPLPAEAERVVVSAANAGVSPDAADTLVRELGPESVRDAVEVALWHKAANPQKAATGSWGGGWIRAMATHLKTGTWTLPAKFLEQRKRNQARQEARRRPVTTAADYGGADFAAWLQMQHAASAAAEATS